MGRPPQPCAPRGCNRGRSAGCSVNDSPRRNAMPTQIRENHAKRMLKADQLGLCFGVNQLRTPNIAMIAAACGFDAVYIDLEHNPNSLETAAGLSLAAIGIALTQLH